MSSHALRAAIQGGRELTGGLARALKEINPSVLQRLREKQPAVEALAKANYIEKDSALRAQNSRMGVRTPANTEKFTTVDGDLIRTNPTTRGPDGTAKYTEYNQTLKDERNSKVDETRQARIEETTEGDVTDFYKFRIDGTDAHHIAELDRTAPLFRGLSVAERTKLFTYFKQKGIVPGHRIYNRADLPKKVHQQFHSWFDQTYGRKAYKNVENLPFNERLSYVDQFIEEYQAAMEKLYELQMASNKAKKAS